MSAMEGNGVRPIWFAIAAHSGLILTMMGWLVAVSYQAGQRARQIDVNTDRILRLETYGSNGTHEKLDELQKAIQELKLSDQKLGERVDRLIEESRR